MLIATKNKLTGSPRLSRAETLTGHFGGVVTGGHVGGVVVVVVGPDKAHNFSESQEVPGGQFEQRVPKVRRGSLQKGIRNMRKWLNPKQPGIYASNAVVEMPYICSVVQ